MTSLIAVCTMPDRSVQIVIPSKEFVFWKLKYGAAISCIAHCPQFGSFRFGLDSFIETHPLVSNALRSHIRSTGYMPLWLARDWEIEKKLSNNSWRRDTPQVERLRLAENWIDAMIDGGLSERQAVDLIVAHGRPNFSTGVEIMERSQLPDCIHRDAWRRSFNGGPITVNENIAANIDAMRLWAKYETATQCPSAP